MDTDRNLIPAELENITEGNVESLSDEAIELFARQISRLEQILPKVQLERFDQDDDLRTLEQHIGRFNIFDVLIIANVEIRHSNVLAWPGGYIGGMQTAITDVAIDPAGSVWVANNWDLPNEGFKKVPDPALALATRFGGNDVVVFFGLAKPVKTPLIGPPPAP